MGRHRAPSRWRQKRTVAPAAAALSTAAVALTASTAPPAVVSSVEVTTGSLAVISPTEDPPTVVLPRIDAAEVAAEVLETARKTTAPTTTPSRKPATATVTPVKPSPVPRAGSLQERIVEAARAYVGRGIPYRYGGKTCTAAAGCDCSALTWHVLQDVGLHVPYRSSTALAGWATPVSKANAVPGDLVLYHGHVGIYAGNNMLIDHGGPGRGANLRHIWGAPAFGRVPARLETS